MLLCLLSFSQVYQFTVSPGEFCSLCPFMGLLQRFITCQFILMHVGLCRYLQAHNMRVQGTDSYGHQDAVTSDNY